MSTPTLWDILDGYLNTNDYDDEFDGYVSLHSYSGGDFAVVFTPSGDASKKIWTIREVKP